MNCSEFRFVLFVDDTVFVNPYRLAELLRPLLATTVLNAGDDWASKHFRYKMSQNRLPTFTYYLGGRVLSYNTPQRNSIMRKISRFDYSHDSYPFFAAGGFMLANRAIIDLLTFTSFHIKFFRIAEVYLGLIMCHLGLQYQYISGICINCMQVQRDPNQFIAISELERDADFISLNKNLNPLVVF